VLSDGVREMPLVLRLMLAEQRVGRNGAAAVAKWSGPGPAAHQTAAVQRAAAHITRSKTKRKDQHPASDPLILLPKQRTPTPRSALSASTERATARPCASRSRRWRSASTPSTSATSAARCARGKRGVPVENSRRFAVCQVHLDSNQGGEGQLDGRGFQGSVVCTGV